ncbi:MAG: putative baseplate assembly protein [Anaerolineales bacterium]|nr:putative baseplate assembly protein [Anaerolineales bacterium]
MDLSLDSSIRELNDCDCCTGVDAETPAPIDNRAGLTAVAYRTGDHAAFVASMHAALSAGRSPALARLTARSNDDFSIALIDAWATTLDVLTFYQERLANEAYLRTATERLSLLELARLIGYRPRPGVAASTLLAFTLEDAPGSPASVEIPVAVKVQSVPGPGETAQTFETVESIEARPGWNGLRARTTTPQRLAGGSTDAYFRGTDFNLATGDILIFVSNERISSMTSERWAWRRVSTVSADAVAGFTRVTWLDALPAVEDATTGASPEVYVLRKRASIFGYNAPEWRALLDSTKAAYMGGTPEGGFPDEWPEYSIFTPFSLNFVGDLAFDFTSPVLLGNVLAMPAPEAQVAVDPNLLAGEGIRLEPGKVINPKPGAATTAETRTIDLDTAYPQIQRDGWALLTRPGAVELYRVTGVTEAGRAQFMLSGKTTRVTLAGENLTASFEDEVRTTSVFAQSERLPLVVEQPLPANATTGHVANLRLATPAPDLPKGRNLIVAGALAGSALLASEAVVLAEAKVVGGVTELRLTAALQNDYILSSVILYANVAAATHGETAVEVLGSGNAAVPFQSFTLRQPPLTYVSSDDPSGATSTLEVRVNDLLWHETPDLLDRKPEDHVYVTTTNDDAKTTVQFGDGFSGARPQTGANNVRATYRKGIGKAGNLDANQLSTLLTRPLGVKAVNNPVPATGGADAETRDQVRGNAPLTVLTLDRVVSLQDYEDFARAFAGIAKALATWTWDGERRGVFITISGEDGAAVLPDNPTYTHLLGALRKAGDPRVPLRLASSTLVTFVLDAQVTRDPDFLADAIQAGVTDALVSAFAFEARGFGQPVTLSEVMAVIQAVDGVIGVDVNKLMRNDLPGIDGLKQPLPSAAPIAGSGLSVAPAELLLIDPGGIKINVV